MAKYPDTNYMPTSVGELGGDNGAKAGAFMVSEFYQICSRGTKRVAGGGVVRFTDGDGGWRRWIGCGVLEVRLS